MKHVAILICLLTFSGCTTYREFRAAPDRYTSIKVGDVYEIQEDMLLLKYDYLIVPLVKPGIQLMPASVAKEAALPKVFAIIGRAKKGDTLRITGYENEGGWIPCQGDWYKVNPMAAFMDGELKGKTIGVSFLCEENTDKLPFRTGKILFARPNEKYIKRKARVAADWAIPTVAELDP
jgi:hypothetical protein